MKTIISKSRFMGFLKVQKSGRRNMFGYDRGIEKYYEECYKHFVDDKKEDNFIGIEHKDINIKNVDVDLLKLQTEAVLRCVEDTKEQEEKNLLNGVWELLQNMLDEVEK